MVACVARRTILAHMVEEGLAPAIRVHPRIKHRCVDTRSPSPLLRTLTRCKGKVAVFRLIVAMSAMTKKLLSVNDLSGPLNPMVLIAHLART